MKNVLLMLVSVVVGYGFAYLSASKKWAPFGKMQGKETTYSKTMTGNSSDSGAVMATEVSKDEMKTMSDNYVAWITELNAKAAKGSKQGNLPAQIVVRGGRISASLLAKLAKSKHDIYYLFGRKMNSNLVYMLLSEPATTTADATMNYDSYIASDSATMCPCICPDNILVSYPECPPDPTVGTLPPGTTVPPPPTQPGN